jgi:lipase chaperone LimK
MFKSNKKIIFIIVLIGATVLAALFFLASTNLNTISNQKSELEVVNEKPTIGTEWQWHKNDQQIFKNQLEIENGLALPFTPESVHRALQAVKLDADGNIILDHDALISLDEVLERIHNQLDSDSLAILQDLIKSSLAGVAGEQTAEIVANYFHFLEAKEEFSQINEAMVDTYSEGTLESIEANQALYAELQALREVHIGYQATSSLFRISDANAQYMFESMKLESDDSFTPEEKNDRRSEIKEQHIEQSINIRDWPARYQAFMSDKKNIIMASIAEEDKRKQLKSLLRQHFDTAEIKRIDYLGLDRL